ncbi:MAG: hypothetical protein KGL39_11530 [Patescibacteria group bacterium]|nr:hypothetical protein [Patescibacteria group bacterium]
MTAYEIYKGADGEATKALYAELEARGPIGVVAMNLFRAQKCSERAKIYRGRRFKDAAYDRKQWSMGLLCAALQAHAAELQIRWGWKLDEGAEFAKWVLYVDLPQGQVSFHSPARGEGPHYDPDWDGAAGWSPTRIIAFCEQLRRVAA